MSEIHHAYHLLKIATELVESIDKEADAALPHKIASTVKACSKGAAIASAAAGALPGAGSVVAATISAGCIWGMYVKINSDIGLSISSNILKTLASGIATNLAVGAVGYLAGFALGFAASFIPVVGTAVSVTTFGILCYVLTLTSGYVYLKLLIHVFRTGKDINLMSAEDLENVAKDVCSKDEIKDVMKEAKAEYKRDEKNGDFKQAR